MTLHLLVFPSAGPQQEGPRDPVTWAVIWEVAAQCSACPASQLCQMLCVHRRPELC